jgi:ElaB/YqjD/DUF883 family membrane-anchored ribosome-binding protein
MNAAVVDLFDGVDDLIRRVADTESAEIRKVRAKVHAALVVAKNACEVESEPVPRPSAVAPAMAANGAVEDGEDWLSQYSAPTLGVALLVGLGLGLMLRQ